jgi:hypothetical protein
MMGVVGVALVANLSQECLTITINCQLNEPLTSIRDRGSATCRIAP